LRVGKINRTENVRERSIGKTIGNGHGRIKSLPLEGKLLIDLQMTGAANSYRSVKWRRQNEEKTVPKSLLEKKIYG